MPFFERLPKMSRSTKIRFSNVVVTHNYESDVELPERKIGASESKGKVYRKVFRNETEAIESERKRVQQQLTQCFLNMEPKLTNFHLSSAHVDELDKLQDVVADELDGLRQVDPNTGDLQESKNFLALESKLLFFLEALECLKQKEYVDNLLNGRDGPCDDYHKDQDSLQSSCFPFMFKKTLIK